MFQRRSVPLRSIAGALCFLAFTAICVFYYSVFANPLPLYEGEQGKLQYALNEHDHRIYLNNIDLVRSGDIPIYMGNDTGIAAIYSFISSANAPNFDADLTLTSLLFNLAVMAWCYRLYSNICEKLDLGAAGRLSFFVNTSLIYFAQLINKDMLTIAVFLFCINSALDKKYFKILLMLPLMVLVRQQLAIFSLIFLYLMHTPKTGTKIGYLYIITSVTAGILSVFAAIIGEESLGSGLSSYLVNFNQQYYVGYLLFNPIRVVQYVFDAYLSFSYGTENFGVDTAKLLRLPQLILLLFLGRHVLSMGTRFSFWIRTPAKGLVIATIAYLLTWLMNPTINARYVMLITPILVLFALYARNHAAQRAQQ